MYGTVKAEGAATLWSTDATTARFPDKRQQFVFELLYRNFFRDNLHNQAHSFPEPDIPFNASNVLYARMR